VAAGQRGDAAVGHRAGYLPLVPADPRIAVVIVTLNGATRISAVLERLLALPQGPEVIVVDNASTDGTAQLVRRRFPAARLIRLAENVGAVGRNAGVAATRAPYVAFAEDDSWYEPEALRIAADLLDRHPDVGLLNAHVLVGETGRSDDLHQEMVDTPLPDRLDLPGHRIVSFLEGASIVRRAAFLAVGGFARELGIGGPEQHLAAELLAAGWELRYVPALRARHMPDHAEPAPRVRRLGLRNALWFAWGRRPPRAALRWTVHLLRCSPRNRTTALALLDALRGAPRVLRARRPLPAAVEAQLALLDGPRLAASARSYGRR
jgi:GT2 family glycosyltransferase